MTAVSTEADEEQQLHYWQFERFGELGYTRFHAELLTFANVDWHKLAWLLENGCDPQTAMEILI